MRIFQFENTNSRAGINLICVAMLATFSFLLASCNATKPASIATVVDTTTFYFVRHAEKAKDDRRDPTLTAEGKLRAQRLAELLKKEKVTAVYSTDYKRTRGTAEPTAQMFDCPTQIYNHKTIDIVGLADSLKFQTVLVVGHSNSTPALVNNLIGEERYEQIDESDYTNLFKVLLKDGEKKVELIKF